LPAFGGIGIGVEEYVPMVESRNELDRLRQQHPISKHVAGHIAATRHAHAFGLDIDAHFKEVSLD